jgi:hypothetical protein
MNGVRWNSLELCCGRVDNPSARICHTLSVDNSSLLDRVHWSCPDGDCAAWPKTLFPAGLRTIACGWNQHGVRPYMEENTGDNRASKLGSWQRGQRCVRVGSSHDALRLPPNAMSKYPTFVCVHAEQAAQRGLSTSSTPWANGARLKGGPTPHRAVANLYQNFACVAREPHPILSADWPGAGGNGKLHLGTGRVPGASCHCPVAHLDPASEVYSSVPTYLARRRHGT